MRNLFLLLVLVYGFAASEPAAAQGGKQQKKARKTARVNISSPLEKQVEEGSPRILAEPPPATPASPASEPHPDSQSIVPRSQQPRPPKADLPKPEASISKEALDNNFVFASSADFSNENGDMGMNWSNMAIPGSAMYVQSNNSRHFQQQTPTHTYFGPRPMAASGCRAPMSETDFAHARSYIQKQSFEDDKLKVMRQIIAASYVTGEQMRSMMKLLTYESSKLNFAKQAIAHSFEPTAAQVSAIMLGFTYEDSRLRFAKYAYSFTRDKFNYYLVNDGFTYSSSVDELNDFIADQLH